MMNAWLFLAIAIVSEVIGTSALKASDGMTRLWPALMSFSAYLVAFYCLALTLRNIPMGIAYAVWSGVGIVLICAIGWLVFGQKLDGPGLLGVGLIVAGVLVLNLFSQTAAD